MPFIFFAMNPSCMSKDSWQKMIRALEASREKGKSKMVTSTPDSIFIVLYNGYYLTMKNRHGISFLAFAMRHNDLPVFLFSKYISYRSCTKLSFIIYVP